MVSSRKSIKSPRTKIRVGVALSGGLDSIVLLDTVCKNGSSLIGKHQVDLEIWAFHVHHGLQNSADQWLEFCAKTAKKFGSFFDYRLVKLANLETEENDLAVNKLKLLGNIEERARIARYEALVDLCNAHDVEDLLLAHHQNDQAETVLLQLLRGAGVAGLSGMPIQKFLKKASGARIAVWRPLLNLSRADLEAYARVNGLNWIEDPSNDDCSFRRNAIRKLILPKLAEIQPSAIANMARSAELFGDAQKLLDRLAVIDGAEILEECNGAFRLRVKPLLALHNSDQSSASNLLRYWLKVQGLAMPSKERLNSWWQDLLTVRTDSRLEWKHDDSRIRFWRGSLQVDDTSLSNNCSPSSGKWTFTPISSRGRSLGLPVGLISQSQKIEFRPRKGPERLQCSENGPRKSIKNLFQENNVPPWQRLAPLLFINDELIAVAGVGVSYPHLVNTGKRVWPEWHIDPAEIQNPVK